MDSPTLAQNELHCSFLIRQPEPDAKACYHQEETSEVLTKGICLEGIVWGMTLFRDMEGNNGYNLEKNHVLEYSSWRKFHFITIIQLIIVSHDLKCNTLTILSMKRYMALEYPVLYRFCTGSHLRNALKPSRNLEDKVI